MIATRDEATAAVLGAVFLAENTVDALIEERVRPDHFHKSHERAIYSTILRLRDTGKPIDHLTVKAALSGAGSPVTATDVDQLATSVPNVANVRGYCEIVRDHAWFDSAQSALSRAWDALRDGKREDLISAVARIDTDQPASIAASTAEQFMAWYARDRQGIKLPFAELTEATGGGFETGETTMVGGWPAMGKTILAQQCLLSGQAAGAVCHEYANEMNGPRRTARLVASLTGIPVAKIVKRSLSHDEWEQTLQLLNRLPYESTATAGWQVEDYCRMIRRRKDDLAVLDTVTNLPCSRVDEWDRACGMLNDAAAQAGTHLILICQLNLERDKGAIKPAPTGRDLRNTGAWYQRARIVMFVHREQEIMDGAQIPRVLPDGHVRIDKATHGEPERGFVEVTFNPRWMRFDRLSDFDYRTQEAAA